MIDIEYKNIFDEFIKKYEEIHVNPWHEISKEELNKIYEELVNSMDIDNECKFKYFMDYIIKRLSGMKDAHTKFSCVRPIPMNFKIFGDDVLINYPSKYRGAKLLSINEVSISKVLDEIDNVITYGTVGRKKHESERALFNKMLLFGLPSFRDTDKLIYKLELNNVVIEREFIKKESYNDLFSYDEYEFGHPGNYKIMNNCLVYEHSSVQNKFKDQIEESINKLRSEDLSDIKALIIDIRGNWGGNSALNKLVMDFVSEQKNKKLICLTDYRVFSAGRYALRDLIELGATTIGEEIATPINCYGNSNWFEIENRQFSVSECYFNPFERRKVSSKQDYKTIEGLEKEDIIFKPDVLVDQNEDDYINGVDTILEYAIKYANEK